MLKNQFALLLKREFLPLFIAQFLGAFNDNVFKNALVILITYRLADAAGFSAQIMVTLAAGIFIFPFFLFSATAGQLADKYEKTMLIFRVKLVEIVLMLIAVVGFYQQSMFLLMTVLFLLGVQAAFFGPLKYAILPEQLPDDELIAGNALVEAGTFLAILLGTIFGGLLILRENGDFYISIAIVGFALCGWVSSWFIPKTVSSNTELRMNYNFMQETYRVVVYAKKRKDIFLAVVGISWFWLMGATFLAEFPVFVKDILHANQNVVTCFFTVFSIGIGIGSLLCNKILKGKINTTYVPLGAAGVTFFTLDLCVAAAHSDFFNANLLMGMQEFLQIFMHWRILIDVMMIAVCGGFYTVPLYAILQQRSDKAYRARVIASNNIVNALFMVLAAIMTMLMLKLGLTVNHVFLVVGILNVGMVCYICQ